MEEVVMGSNTVLVTGASSGIGKETARTLLGEGYTVYAAARRVEKMDDLKEIGGIPLKMDITQEDDRIAVVEQIEAGQDGVDILVGPMAKQFLFVRKWFGDRAFDWLLTRAGS
jgi:NADP-dependent 3-hydroxy acid dehydrogenase YdfG